MKLRTKFLYKLSYGGWQCIITNGIYFAYHTGIFYFSFWGYGLHFTNLNLHKLRFSERMGITKGIEIFKIWITVKKP